MTALGNFVFSFAAARKLLVLASKSGSLIEAMVLYVSLIDGLLRIALVLHMQLRAGNGEIDSSYVEQVPGGRKYSEKAVYDQACTEGLISETLKAEIVDLYDKRNATIHRFFLSDLRYADLGPLLDRYEEIYEECLAIVATLEGRQVSERAGMTHDGPVTEDDRRRFGDAVIAKLGFDPGL